MSRWTAADALWMDRALALGARAYGQTSPNPMVGAVLVKDGEVLGEGLHAAAGLPHAEPQALDAAAACLAGASSTDLTLYVNLEPCVHHGQTPPCVDAILRAPVRRVVVAMVDPNPQVSGRGITRLRAAGVQVDVGCQRSEAQELNRLFIARQLRRRPAVTLKVALSKDDCIAAADGSPVRISGEAALKHAHQLRAGHDAILVGVETLRRDRPLLDRRLYHGPGGHPRRAVLDPHLRSVPEWLWPGREAPLVFCAQGAQASRRCALEGAAELVELPWEEGAGFDLAALGVELGARRIWSVLVEGGGQTHRAFLAAGMWDRLYVYRNRRLELSGLAWQAAWDAMGTICRPGRLLGDDRLEVFDHPASVPPRGNEPGRAGQPVER